MIAVKPFLSYNSLINCFSDGAVWITAMRAILETAILGKFSNIGKSPVDTPEVLLINTIVAGEQQKFTLILTEGKNQQVSAMFRVNDLNFVGE